jgi:hypothetical protein
MSSIEQRPTVRDEYTVFFYDTGKPVHVIDDSDCNALVAGRG